jgi:hypothetical protein
MNCLCDAKLSQCQFARWAKRRWKTTEECVGPSLISNININFGLNEGARDFGLDANDRLVIDNSTLEQIPEPSALGLLAAASFLRWTRRREG